MVGVLILALRFLTILGPFNQADTWDLPQASQLGIISSRWWFQTSFIFTPIWGRFPMWLIFFRWVETTNQFMYNQRFPVNQPIALGNQLISGNRCDSRSYFSSLPMVGPLRFSWLKALGDSRLNVVKNLGHFRGDPKNVCAAAYCCLWMVRYWGASANLKENIDLDEFKIEKNDVSKKNVVCWAIYMYYRCMYIFI